MYRILQIVQLNFDSFNRKAWHSNPEKSYIVCRSFVMPRHAYEITLNKFSILLKICIQFVKMRDFLKTSFFMKCVFMTHSLWKLRT